MIKNHEFKPKRFGIKCNIYSQIEIFKHLVNTSIDTESSNRSHINLQLE